MTIWDVDGTVISRSTEYGVKTNRWTLEIGERIFKTNRKCGIGKSASIWEENVFGECRKVTIDHIEEVLSRTEEFFRAQRRARREAQ
jgi:hypothetical protein